MEVKTTYQKVKRTGIVTQEDIMPGVQFGEMLQSMCEQLDNENNFRCADCPFYHLCGTTEDELLSKMRAWFDRDLSQATIRIEWSERK